MDKIIRWSLDKRLFVVIASLALTIYGAWATLSMPVDVFPDLTAPTVTVITEAHGLAPEEVEALVTFPIESGVNGATGVRRVRSSSGIGISVVWVEFDWGTDIYIARQIVNEKLQLITSQIPPDIGPPTLAPISSIMGEILFLSMTSDAHTELEVREAADWIVRKRLLGLPGVAQVIPLGGAVTQWQVLVDPTRMAALDVTLEQVMKALHQSNANTSGGFYVRGPQESLIRGVGRVTRREDLSNTVVAVVGGAPVLVGHVADVVIGPAPKRGEGSANAKRAVVIGVLKQPGANTLELTSLIDDTLDAIEKSLPAGMKIDRNAFRQADFIETSVENVSHALRDGAILVMVIIFLFLLNWQATLVSLAALPVSLVVAVLALDAMGATINTMTLGGLTIAIGSLVDDAIIDVENVVRRLRENQALPDGMRRASLDVIYEASKEVRSSIVFATVIVMLVFLPLFFLSGVEGRLLFPLGFAYLVAIFASLVVALTLTPALCAYVLPKGAKTAHRESIVVRGLKAMYRPVLQMAVNLPWVVAGAAVAMVVGAVILVGSLGRAFLPEFNEGALTVSAVTLPGTSLAESDRMGRRVEELLLAFPEVVSTARRTGRAELDEHAQDVNAAEIDVRLAMGERSKSEMLDAMRKEMTKLPGMVVTFGQPLSHRIDHMLSGTRANIAIKLFGDDLGQLRSSAESIKSAMEGVQGVVDLSIEQQIDVPQLALSFDREAIARYGARTGELAEVIEIAFAGAKVTQVLKDQRTYDVVVRYHDENRRDLDAIGRTLIDVPTGERVPLSMLARVIPDSGPSTVSRENVQRKVVIMANVADRDLGSVVADIRAAIESDVKLPEGYYVEYGGQFESEQEASRTIAIFGGVVIAGILLILYLAFRSLRSALIVMVNLPLALIGGVAAVYLGSGIISIASLVGFITLFGIATRNGIMMVSHYDHLITVEGASFDEAIIRGSLERLSPILMTALSAGLALIPLVLAGEAPGNEIQAPMGVVILGGLITSTALNMIVLPALYARFGRRQATSEVVHESPLRVATT